jgi:hypothetical protein
MSDLYEYDVDQARALVRDGREPVEVEVESVRHSVASSTIDDFHVPHVDPTIPGVIAHVQFHVDSGECVKGHLLIDGHHRAARCLKEGRPFFAYLLNEAESEAILLRSPPAPARPACAELELEPALTGQDWQFSL